MTCPTPDCFLPKVLLLAFCLNSFASKLTWKTHSPPKSKQFRTIYSPELVKCCTVVRLQHFKEMGTSLVFREHPNCPVKPIQMLSFMQILLVLCKRSLDDPSHVDIYEFGYSGNPDLEQAKPEKGANLYIGRRSPLAFPIHNCMDEILPHQSEWGSHHWYQRDKDFILQLHWIYSSKELRRGLGLNHLIHDEVLAP